MGMRARTQSTPWASISRSKSFPMAEAKSYTSTTVIIRLGLASSAGERCPLDDAGDEPRLLLQSIFPPSKYITQNKTRKLLTVIHNCTPGGVKPLSNRQGDTMQVRLVSIDNVANWRYPGTSLYQSAVSHLSGDWSVAPILYTDMQCKC